MDLNQTERSFPVPNSSGKISGLEFEKDQWYLRLIQLVHLLGAAFVAPHFWKSGKTLDDTFEQLMHTVNELTGMPNHNGAILLRENDKSVKNPKSNVARYSVEFGNLQMDTKIATHVAERSEASVTQLLRKLQIAFDIFSINGIHDLCLRLPNEGKESLEHLRFSLEVLSHFDQAVQSGDPLVCQGVKKQITIPIINGDDRKADFNLTLAAALNHLDQMTMGEMIRTVRSYIDERLKPSYPENVYNIFTVMFYSEEFKGALLLPPLEVNTLKYKDSSSLLKLDIPALPSDSNKKLRQIDANDTALESSKDERVLELTQTVSKSQQTLRKTAVNSVNTQEPSEQLEVRSEKNNGGDYQSVIDRDAFQKHLKVATDLLASLENESKGGEILTDIIETLQQGIMRINSEVSNHTSPDDEQSNFGGKHSPEIIEKLHNRVSKMISRFTERSDEKEVKVDAHRKGTEFHRLDHEKISQKFGLATAETKDILGILEECFDSRGYFMRTEFEIRIPKFIAHEKKIFEFLWEHLKELLHRKDRVAFLNSLYLLVSEMKQPKKALGILLNELCHAPLKISYSDRNAFMLASLLLRRYTKELVDIEMTPGEVLLVKNGLNEEVRQFALLRIEADQQLLETKLETVHNRLIKAFEIGPPESISWDPHFMLSLEREAFIFISLVGGDAARSILISALSEYGNPKSKIYSCNLEGKFILLLLQHLKLIIRGLGRAGDVEDLGLLADLKKNETEFNTMLESPQHVNNVSQVFKMIDIAMGNITLLQ